MTLLDGGMQTGDRANWRLYAEDFRLLAMKEPDGDCRSKARATTLTASEGPALHLKTKARNVVAGLNWRRMESHLTVCAVAAVRLRRCGTGLLNVRSGNRDWYFAR